MKRHLSTTAAASWRAATQAAMLLAACWFSASAQAQTANADAKNGASIAQNGLPPAVAACASCHGAQGEGMAAFPPLAGQAGGYLRSQLDAFADGSRNNAIMAPIAKGLNAQQRADVAAYFAALPSGLRAVPAAAPDGKDKGAWLVLRGRQADGIPACASCHGPGGAGVGAQFPAIGKLNASYVQQQIDAWKQGQRGAGPLGLMGSIAKKLSNDDVAAIAQYYATLNGGAAQ